MHIFTMRQNKVADDVYNDPFDNPYDDPEAEVERLRGIIAGLQYAERGGDAPPPQPLKDFAIQEQPSSSPSAFRYKKIYRQCVSAFGALVLVGGIALGIILLKDFLRTNDISLIPNQPGTTQITSTELALHNTPDDCWIVLHGDVYDLTNYARRHPGGSSIVTRLAGTDGTVEYARFHSESLLRSVRGDMIGPYSDEEANGGDMLLDESEDEEEDGGGCVDQDVAFNDRPKWNCDWVGKKPKQRCPKVWEGMTLSEYCPVTCDAECGEGSVDDEEQDDSDLGGNNGTSDVDCTAATNCISMEELARHNTPEDCWVAMHGDVYDMTEYANRHPGGARVVTDLAGTDGTAEYNRFHSQHLLSRVQETLVGRLEGAGTSNNVDVGQ